ncbi:hypothetical protein FACS1894211_15090 [Clostridia bacterium]|nr:hypothetical protein FACS1894211_15090 [Clostridia bacterium]
MSEREEKAVLATERKEEVEREILTTGQQREKEQKEQEDIRRKIVERLAQIFKTGPYGVPKRWDGDDFFKTLSDLFRTYCAAVRIAVDGLSGQSDCEQTLKRFMPDGLPEIVSEICDGLQKVVRLNCGGLPVDAFAAFQKVMERLQKEPLYTDKQDEIVWYRVRKVEENREHTRREIFHVPFKMRHRIASRRYSIPGYPCLYLCDKIELCMEEAAGENKKYTVVSEFRLRRRYDFKANPALRIFDIGLKPGDAFPENDVRKAFTYILWYPLIAACSYIRVHSGADFYFYPEYIVPQLLMQWLRKSAENASIVYGVRYFSCVSEAAGNMGYNYAFASCGGADQTYCPSLDRLFVLTKPAFLDEYKTQNSFIDYGKVTEDLAKADGGRVSDGDGKIQKDYFEDTEVIVPPEVGEISDRVFEENRNIRRLTLGVNVQRIGGWAFSHCENLKEVVFAPDSGLEEIGDYAFFESGLERIELPKGVKRIGNSAFSYCRKLKEVVFVSDGELEEIGKSAFRRSKFERIEIPKGVKRIGKGALSWCNNLKEVVFAPDGELEEIGESAFWWSGLERIEIPKGVKRIGKNAFDSCRNLKEVVFAPDGELEEIGESAFWWSGLERIEIPKGVKRIGKNAFCFCNHLKEVVIPAHLSEAIKHALPKGWTGKITVRP